MGGKRSCCALLACMARSHGNLTEDPRNTQVFYASPSIAVLAFLHEICATATAIHVDGGTATDALQTILQLANALQVSSSRACRSHAARTCPVHQALVLSIFCLISAQIFLSGAHSLRGYQQQWFGAAFNVAVAEFAEPEWTAAESARIALQSLVDAIVRCGIMSPVLSSVHVAIFQACTIRRNAGMRAGSLLR